MSRTQRIAFLCLVAVVAAAPAWAQSAPTPPLTLRQTLDLALRQNPGLKAVQAQEQGALYGYHSAIKLPPLQLSVNYVGGNNNVPSLNGTTQDYNVAATQSLGPVGSTAYNGRVAWQGYLIAQFATQQARVTLLQSVKDAFYVLLAAQEQETVAQENLTLATHVHGVARKRFEAGAGPQMDLLSAEIQLATSKQAMIQAEAARKLAQTALPPLLGMPAGTSPQVAGTLEMTPPPLSLAKLVEAAEAGHPQMAIARLAVEQARTQVKQVGSQAHLTPSISYLYDLRTTPLYNIGASLSIPLDWGQVRNQVRQQKKVVEEKEHALQGARLSAGAAVKTAYENLQAALANAATYRQSVLRPSEKLARIVEIGYSQGALPYLNVLNAVQNLKTARNQYVTLLLTGHQALDALEAAVGKPLEESQP